MGTYRNKGNKATKEGFGEGILEAARRNKNVVGIGADITHSVNLSLFAAAFPERYISLGIAEQNCMGAAAGLALSGKIPVFPTYAVFSAMRTTDFVRISVCYNNFHVVIGGGHAGISVGPDGATHQALEDVAIMRVMPNMTVLSPCDSTQARKAAIAAVEQIEGPVYIRFGRAPAPNFTPASLEFIPGKAQIMKEGSDISIIATGVLVWEALQAAKILRKEGINARVINLHTIKPLDKETILDAARETGRIITVEEHQKMGGMGSAVAEFLAASHPVPIHFIGVDDRFGESGQPGELMKKYRLNASAISREARYLLSPDQEPPEL
ncbi:MAG: transketolase C-terminal domain-containing protein [Bacteroidales bacterium]